MSIHLHDPSLTGPAIYDTLLNIQRTRLQDCVYTFRILVMPPQATYILNYSDG